MANAERTARSSVTIGTSSSVLWRALNNGRRVLFSVTNTSTSNQIVYLAFSGQNAVVGQGIVLNPGGFYVESIDQNFSPTMDEIQAISDSANATLALTMRVEGGIQ